MRDQETNYCRKWYVMAAGGMSTFLATINGSIVSVALPTLVRELDAGFALALSVWALVRERRYRAAGLRLQP